MTRQNRKKLPVKQELSWRDKLINLEFNDVEQKRFIEWVDGRDIDGLSKIPEHIEDGWKISFSYSSHFDCYFCSITDKEVGSSVEGKTVIVRHRSFEKLTQLMVYVIDELIEQSHHELAPQKDNLDW